MGRRLILVTTHRRESWGGDLEAICGAIREIAERRSNIMVALPVHPNPNVRIPLGCPPTSSPMRNGTWSSATGWASFFYQTYDSISYLQQTVIGLKNMGYTFVSPTAA